MFTALCWWLASIITSAILLCVIYPVRSNSVIVTAATTITGVMTILTTVRLVQAVVTEIPL